MSNPFLDDDAVATPQKIDSVLESVTISKPKHLSPSTINSFLERRSVWFKEKVLKQGVFQQTPYFIRGTAVEAGIIEVLKGKSLAEAVEVAENLVKAENVDHLSKEDLEKLAVHYSSLRGYIEAGAVEIQMYGQMVDNQRQISLQLDSCSMPIMGYVDFVMDTPAVLDTKILGKKPSGLTQSYSIQGTVYRVATKLPVIFIAVVRTEPKGVPTFKAYQENVEKQELPLIYWLDYIKMATEAIEGVYDCAISGDTIGLIKHMSFPDLSSMFEQRDRNEMLKMWKTLK